MKVRWIGWALMGLAVMALTTMHTTPAGAFALEFSQTTGFHSTTGTLQGLGQGNPAIAGQGGLEYFGKVTAPPGPPLGDSSAPPSIFQIVGWGCTPSLTGVIPPATCANGGTIGSTTSPATNPFTNINRSSLQVLGQFGSFVDASWSDITIVNHHNNVISGNVLNTIGIDSILRLGPTGAVFDVPPIHTLTANFTETFNSAPCTASAGSGAPVNPLGSTCDDFVLVSAIDLTSIFIPAGTFGTNPDMFLDFRLDPRLGALVCTGKAGQPAACGAYSGSAVIIYTDETDTHGLAVQGRLRFVPEPASLLLLGAGLLGTAALAARRRRHS